MALKLKTPIVQAVDVLVIGGGGGGLRASIAALQTGVEVLLVSRSRAGYGNNTAIARGAFAAAGGWCEPRDSPEIHREDTLRSGHFINNPRLVEVLAQGGIQQVYDLESLGVNFVKAGETYGVGHMPGHTYPRNVACIKRIGIGITIPMRRYALDLGVNLLEGVTVTKLLKKGKTVVGALGVDSEGQPYCLWAKATILASGGLGQIYQRTNNAVDATGDGYALAYEAGALLQDMEFVQFYPTCLARGRTMPLVAYEHLVFMGGAIVRNSLGQDILELYELRKPGAMTRDQLARAIMREVLAGRSQQGFVSLDLTTIPESKRERYRFALPKGASYEQGSLLVSPAAHYAMGGVQINEHAETCLEGLYAVGEVCGGIQGANRLAGNALTEIFVFGTIAGERASERAKTISKPQIAEPAARQELAHLEGRLNLTGEESLPNLTASLKKTMWDKVGVVREAKGLAEANSEILALRQALGRASVSSPQEWFQALRLEKMLTVAEMVARSAWMRRESRGAHYRSDYPVEKNPEWLCNIVVRRHWRGMGLSVSPVSSPPRK